MQKVLFVCLGNICRSPMAEGIFIDLIEKSGLSKSVEIDSAGTASYHIGELPDHRMRDTARKNGIELVRTARQFVASDFSEFDYILAMDSSNLNDMLSLKPDGQTKAQVFLMREFDELEKGASVPDPYYGGLNGFDEVYDILLRSNTAFLEFMQSNDQQGD
jgi:protein-tyrosine phosphatase